MNNEEKVAFSKTYESILSAARSVKLFALLLYGFLAISILGLGICLNSVAKNAESRCAEILEAQNEIIENQKTYYDSLKGEYDELMSYASQQFLRQLDTDPQLLAEGLAWLDNNYGSTYLFDLLKEDVGYSSVDDYLKSGSPDNIKKAKELFETDENAKKKAIAYTKDYLDRGVTGLFTGKTPSSANQEGDWNSPPD